jgi:hypothetical protein
MTEWNHDNIYKYAKEIGEYFRSLPQEQQVKPSEVLARMKIFTPMLLRESKRLSDLIAQAESSPSDTRLEREADDCYRRGCILKLIQDKLLEELKVLLVNFSV